MESSTNEKELQDRFLKWTKDNNIFFHPKLNMFATFENGLRGVEVLSNIDKGTQLIVVPETAYLSPPSLLSQDAIQTTHMDKDLVQFLRSESPAISSWLQIVLVIMHELANESSNRESYYSSYFKILPKRNEITSILYFKQDELDALKGTTVERFTDSVDLQSQFESNVLPILKKKPEWWPESVQNVEVFKHCAGLIASRGFHDDATGDGPFLIPGIDLLNHDSNECQTIMKRTEDKKFIIEASRYIGANEQLFNMYGTLSNAQLLHTYGFLESDNKYDNVYISVDVVLEQCEKHEEEEIKSKELQAAKKECLATHGYLPNEYYIISKEDMLPEILLTTIQVMFMDSETFEEYKQDPILLGDFSAEEEEDEDLMVNVYKTLIAIIDAKLVSYPTTLRTDIGLLKTKISDNMRKAIVLRIEEKRLLSDLKAQFVEEIMDITQTNKEEEEEEDNKKKRKPNKGNKNNNNNNKNKKGKDVKKKRKF